MRPPAERPCVILPLATGIPISANAAGLVVLVAGLLVTAGWLLWLYR